MSISKEFRVRPRTAGRVKEISLAFGLHQDLRSTGVTGLRFRRFTRCASFFTPTCGARRLKTAGASLVGRDSDILPRPQERNGNQVGAEARFRVLFFSEFNAQITGRLMAVAFSQYLGGSLH